MTEYDRLSIELMSKMTGKELPENWRFTVQAKRLLAIHVCCITGLSQDRWDKLSKAKRIPWLQKAIDAVEGTSIEGEWIEGEDLSDYRPTEAYKPGSELNRILSDLNDSPSVLNCKFVAFGLAHC